MARAILVVAALALLVGASATLVEFDRAPAIEPTTGWALFGAAEPSQPLDVMIHMHRTNMEELKKMVLEISDPDSHVYTRYPALEEVNRLTAASPASVAAVSSWLAESGVSVDDISLGMPEDHINVRLTVEQAARLFAADIRRASNSKTGQTAITATGALHLPSHIAPHVSAVFGLTGLPLPPKKQATPAPVGTNVTPDIIHKAYKVSGVKPNGNIANRQAVAEFQGQLMSKSDLATFFKKYVPHAAPGDDKVYKFVGDSQQGEGVEANLDIQYIMGVAAGVKTEMWAYGGENFCSDLITFTNGILADKDHPNVFSISYGWQGAVSQLGCMNSQVKTVDDNFAKIASQGVSIIFASGDSGSAWDGVKLWPSWPAISPWVTAVGATRFINNVAGPGAERAVDQFGSGGGFAWTGDRSKAQWQEADVTNYLNKYKQPPAQDFNKGGRGTPDVAALGEGFQVIMNGGATPVGGTSAAAPTFSALVSLLNEARHQAGKAPLGFLNPFIYKNKDAFTDVTVGTGKVQRDGFPAAEGFNCEPGWDAVTGLGTADFPKLLDAAKSA